MLRKKKSVFCAVANCICCILRLCQVHINYCIRIFFSGNPFCERLHVRTILRVFLNIVPQYSKRRGPCHKTRAPMQCRKRPSNSLEGRETPHQGRSRNQIFLEAGRREKRSPPLSNNRQEHSRMSRDADATQHRHRAVFPLTFDKGESVPPVNCVSADLHGGG